MRTDEDRLAARELGREVEDLDQGNPHIDASICKLLGIEPEFRLTAELQDCIALLGIVDVDYTIGHVAKAHPNYKEGSRYYCRIFKPIQGFHSGDISHGSHSDVRLAITRSILLAFENGTDFNRREADTPEPAREPTEYERYLAQPDYPGYLMAKRARDAETGEDETAPAESEYGLCHVRRLVIDDYLGTWVDLSGATLVGCAFKVADTRRLTEVEFTEYQHRVLQDGGVRWTIELLNKE